MHVACYEPWHYVGGGDLKKEDFSSVVPDKTNLSLSSIPQVHTIECEIAAG